MDFGPVQRSNVSCFKTGIFLALSDSPHQVRRTFPFIVSPELVITLTEVSQSNNMIVGNNVSNI